MVECLEKKFEDDSLDLTKQTFNCSKSVIKCKKGLEICSKLTIMTPEPRLILFYMEQLLHWNYFIYSQLLLKILKCVYARCMSGGGIQALTNCSAKHGIDLEITRNYESFSLKI